MDTERPKPNGSRVTAVPPVEGSFNDSRPSTAVEIEEAFPTNGVEAGFTMVNSKPVAESDKKLVAKYMEGLEIAGNLEWELEQKLRKEERKAAHYQRLSELELERIDKLNREIEESETALKELDERERKDELFGKATGVESITEVPKPWEDHTLFTQREVFRESNPRANYINDFMERGKAEGRGLQVLSMDETISLEKNVRSLEGEILNSEIPV